MKKIGKFMKWIPPVFFGLLMFAGGAATVIFLLATLLTLPTPLLQRFKKEKLKIGTGLTVLLCGVLFVAGVMVTPTAPTDNNTDEPSRSMSVEVEDETNESSSTSAEEKETTATTTSTDEQTTTTSPAVTTTVETTTTTVTTPEPTTPEDSSFSVTYLDVGQAATAMRSMTSRNMLTVTVVVSQFQV